MVILFSQINRQIYFSAFQGEPRQASLSVIFLSFSVFNLHFPSIVSLLTDGEERRGWRVLLAGMPFLLSLF